MRFVHARGAFETDRCLVMGIINRTPDSFYDGGRMNLNGSIEHALRLEDEGADVLDLGAVKAGPGEQVSLEEEWERLRPLLSALADRCSVPLSVETGAPEIVRRAIDSGAAIVNDVTALAHPDLAPAVADRGAGLIVMHNGGQIRGRPRSPRYGDVVVEVGRDLEEMAATAETAGVASDAIAIDPGLDFGKTTFHSLELVGRLDELTSGPRPVLLAASRKDVVGETLALPPDERLEGSLALVTLAVDKGAAFVRVHDVAPSVRTVRMVEAVLGRRPPDAPTRGLWD